MVGAVQLRLTERFYTTEFHSEADLLAACRRQEVGAFEQLYRAHASRLKSIAYHIVGNRQDAEDAVQEAFLKAYRGMRGFSGQSSLGTWLCRIVINACYDLARKRKPEAEMPAEQPGPKNQLPLKVALEDAMRRINPRFRLVFLLFEVEGLRHSEIASILEVPEGTCRAWLFEAKKELKKMLTEARS
jgi:RNA polymerase sigma-70 factor (ECF subfamily)